MNRSALTNRNPFVEPDDENDGVEMTICHVSDAILMLQGALATPAGESLELSSAQAHGMTKTLEGLHCALGEVLHRLDERETKRNTVQEVAA